MRPIRRLLRAALVLVVLVVATGVFLGSCVFAAPRYRGPASDHFDGERFFYRAPSDSDWLDAAKWGLTRERGPWPDWIESEPGPPPPPSVDGDAMRATFVSHATVLLQMEGRNVLTDPHWSERASPLTFVGPKRVQAPGVRFEDLPKIDVVLISHNHYDHLDIPTLRRLVERDRPLILVGLGVDLHLRAEGIEPVRAVDWGDVVEHGPLRITSVASRHFSGRGLTDRDATLWSAFVVEGARAGAFYFGGDTGYGEHFREVGARFPSLRLAILPIGAFQPRWFMSPVHVDPAEALQAQKDLGAETALAIHHSTFPLADDAYDEPVRLLRAALDAHAEPRPRFWVLGFGEGRDVPPSPAATAAGGEAR